MAPVGQYQARAQSEAGQRHCPPAPCAHGPPTGSDFSPQLSCEPAGQPPGALPKGPSPHPHPHPHPPSASQHLSQASGPCSSPAERCRGAACPVRSNAHNPGSRTRPSLHL